MRTKSSMNLEGHLQIIIYGALGEVLKRFAIKNTITFDGELSVLNLWAQNVGVATDWQMQELRVGASAIPPTKSDTSLGSPHGTVMSLSPASRIINPSTNQLTLSGSLGVGILTGVYLREVGIFSGNGKMLTRQVHPEILKTVPITVSYSWIMAVTS